jgi:hypothetical protein
LIFPSTHNRHTNSVFNAQGNSPIISALMSTVSHIWGDIFEEIHVKNTCTSREYLWKIYFTKQMDETVCLTIVCF